MKANELRQRSKEELKEIVNDLKKKLQELRFDLVSGKVKNVREIRKTRKKIARTLTILAEKQHKNKEK